jgi:hypothetical protein
MKKYISESIFKLIVVLFITNVITGTSQVSSSDIVYAGRSFTWGANMSSYDHVVLFRSNGTFCESLEEKDWQTKVTGYYKRGKDKIFMEYLDKAEENDTIFFETDEEGYESIYYAGTQMVKMIVPNTVPEGYYDFSSATSSGGMGTGMLYVGTQNYEGFNFYNNGTFDRNTSGGVMVTGNNIGGGTGNNSSGKGKYSIKNGLLTLYYNDEQIEKNSFFYEKPKEGEISLVAINGSIFFFGDSEENEAKEPSLIQEHSAQEVGVSNDSKSSGLNILKSTKKAHGGEAIDELKTIKMEVVISGMDFQVLMDVDRKYIRLESLMPNFKYVEQLEGSSGWIYQSAAIKRMTSNRIKELEATFFSGIFGLRKNILDSAKILDIRDTKDNLQLITLSIESETIGYVVNKNSYTITATFILKDGKNEITYLDNLKPINGLLLPFLEVTETDGANIEVLYKNYNINPLFTDSHWSRPE